MQERPPFLAFSSLDMALLTVPSNDKFRIVMPEITILKSELNKFVITLLFEILHSRSSKVVVFILVKYESRHPESGVRVLEE
jgi:hypothetical protein